MCRSILCFSTNCVGSLSYYTLNNLFPMLCFPQVIPSLLGQLLERDVKSRDLFAYVSVQNIGVKDGKPVPVRGQILKCNLTKSRLATGVILAEVQLTKIFFIVPNGFIVAYFETNFYLLKLCLSTRLLGQEVLRQIL